MVENVVTVLHLSGTGELSHVSEVTNNVRVSWGPVTMYNAGRLRAWVLRFIDGSCSWARALCM